MLYSKPNEVIKKVSKSSIQISSFTSGGKVSTLQVGHKYVVKGWVDGVHVYFIEDRRCGYMTNSKTVNSIKALKEAL